MVITVHTRDARGMYWLVVSIASKTEISRKREQIEKPVKNDWVGDLFDCERKTVGRALSSQLTPENPGRQGCRR